MSKNLWKKLSSKKVYQNPYFYVTEDKVVRPNKKQGEYFVIKTNPSVMIVAVTSQAEFYLVGLHRYTTDVFSWEIPGGGTDGEDVIEAGKRELQEEVGLASDTWEDLGFQQTFNGNSDKKFSVLLARDVYEIGNHQQKEEGISEVIKASFPEILEMIKNSKIIDAESISSLMLAALKLGLISLI